MVLMQMPMQGRPKDAVRQKKHCQRVQAPQGWMPTINPWKVNRMIMAAAEAGDLHSFLAVIDQYLSQMNPVNLSTSIHRLAKFADEGPEVHLALVHSPVFEAVQKAIRPALINSKDTAGLPQCISNITWSLAHLHIVDLELLELLCCRAISSMSGFKPYELSTLLWAFAKLGVVDSMADDLADLFRVASHQIRGRLASFSFRSLANIAWAFATAKQRDAALFSDLAREMCSSVHAAKCQEIGNTIWAFAVAGHRDCRLQHALAQAALPLMNGFKAQEISNMLWGFATNGYWHEEVFVQSITMATRMELVSQHVANILWACVRVMPKALAMTYVIRLVPLCTCRLGAFKPQEVSSTVAAIAKVSLAEEDEGASSSPKVPLHQDILKFLTGVAEWVAGYSHLFTSSSFVTAVSSLVRLGARAERPVDLVVEQAVVFQAGILTAAEKLSLLKAFLCTARMARRAISALAAGLLSNFDNLKPRDLQALTRLCATARQKARSDSPPEATEAIANPSSEEVRTWCFALAADPWSSGVEQPSDPDAEADEAAHLESIESSSEAVSDVDPARFGSDFGIETAESLPYLDWQPKDLSEDAKEGEQVVHHQFHGRTELLPNLVQVTFNGMTQLCWVIEKAE